ncbi:hypothetical protein Tiera_051 [Polaromonas phage Tiera]|nr:hypothetical protein Tiera_051 [Polaromonas phage Tiera]
MSNTPTTKPKLPHYWADCNREHPLNQRPKVTFDQLCLSASLSCHYGTIAAKNTRKEFSYYNATAVQKFAETK